MIMAKNPKTTVSIGDGPAVDFDEFTSRVQDLAGDFGVQQIENHLLQAMARNGAKDLIRAIALGESDILADLQRIREEAEEDEKLKFKIGLSVTLDLDKSTVETAFSYSVKTSVKRTHPVSRPDEPELAFGEGGQ
jgi:hypothetical protein